MTQEIKKNIHFLKMYKQFIRAVITGVMPQEQVERIAQKTWEIELLLNSKEII